MTTHKALWSGLVTATILFGATAVTGEAGPQEPPTAATPHSGPSGSYLYRTYCAACHGASARGDGPLADSMRRRPPNLTEIAKRNQGTYPKDLVFKVIDGRQRVPGHGGPDMPVWGDAFKRTIQGSDEASVAARIQALVNYLETIQVRDTQ